MDDNKFLEIVKDAWTALVLSMDYEHCSTEITKNHRSQRSIKVSSKTGDKFFNMEMFVHRMRNGESTFCVDLRIENEEGVSNFHQVCHKDEETAESLYNKLNDYLQLCKEYCLSL